jgi:alkylated DNA repair dioxygenase AlkB
MKRKSNPNTNIEEDILVKKIKVESNIAKYVTVENNFIDKDTADTLFSLLKNHKGARQYTFPNPFKNGEMVASPRLELLLSTMPGKTYTYSKKTLISEAMPAQLQEIMHRINPTLNTCLVNFYRDGNDYIAAHADNEKELEENGKVVSLSLCEVGGERTFRLRNKKDKSDIVDFRTEHGQLLTMEKGCQSACTHEIPKQLKIKKMRISLTFRQHK